MDYETVGAAAFGASLRGLGINLLVCDAADAAARLTAAFDIRAHQVSRDFALMRYGASLFQLHGDATYRGNALLTLVPENPPRGGGVELRLFDTDPDAAVARAEAAGFTLLAAPADKPHGLREAILLCPDGYAWLPSRPL